MEFFREDPKQKETEAEREEKFEQLRGPFIAAVQKEVAKIVEAGKMTKEEALRKIVEANSVDVALSEKKDARIFAWQGIASQEEIQKIQNGEA